MIRIKDYIFNENEIKRIELLRYSTYTTIEVTTNDCRCDCGTATFEDIEWNYEDEQIRRCLDSINREEELEEENKKLKEELHKASLDIQELTEKDIGCPSWCDKLNKLEEENKKLKEATANLIKDSANLEVKINKAIEYINDTTFRFLHIDDLEKYTKELREDLLKILKGEE